MNFKSFLSGLGTDTDLVTKKSQTDVDTPWIRDFYTDLYYGFSKGSAEATATLEKHQQEFAFQDTKSKH